MYIYVYIYICLHICLIYVDFPQQVCMSVESIVCGYISSKYSADLNLSWQGAEASAGRRDVPPPDDFCRASSRPEWMSFFCVLGPLRLLRGSFALTTASAVYTPRSQGTF